MNGQTLLTCLEFKDEVLLKQGSMEAACSCKQVSNMIVSNNSFVK
jgi:hypothetical protein